MFLNTILPFSISNIYNSPLSYYYTQSIHTFIFYDFWTYYLRFFKNENVEK